MVKVQKTFSLTQEVVTPLENEDNQSKVVEQLLRERYDL